MKIITEPKVTLIAKQVFIEHPEYKIPDDGNDAVKIGAFAAKGCYDSFSATGRPNESNQKAILEHQHGSVLEHITFTFFIEGITRSLSLESNRHRQLAVSQRSTRYAAEEDSAIVLDPYYADIVKKHKLTMNDDGMYEIPVNYEELSNSAQDEIDLLTSHTDHAWMAIDQYQREVELLMKLNPNKLEGFDLRKWARGKARNILPHSLETRITYTGNVRAWRWFIESRSDAHAEPEIRRLAHELYLALRHEAPVYFEDFHIEEVIDGIPVWKPEFRKV
jgi:thymidylate synthase (FAD)